METTLIIYITAIIMAIDDHYLQKGSSFHKSIIIEYNYMAGL